MQFSLLLLVIILTELGIGVYSYTKTGELSNALDRGFNKTLQHYKENEKVWDMVQTELHCCGINGPDDFPPVLNTTVLPKSCCPLLTETNCTKADAIQDGCEQTLFKLLDSKKIIFGAVAIAVGLVQVS